jgi:hypothetical protein
MQIDAIACLPFTRSHQSQRQRKYPVSRPARDREFGCHCGSPSSYCSFSTEQKTKLFCPEGVGAMETIALPISYPNRLSVPLAAKGEIRLYRRLNSRRGQPG